MVSQCRLGRATHAEIPGRHSFPIHSFYNFITGRYFVIQERSRKYFLLADRQKQRPNRKETEMISRITNIHGLVYRFEFLLGRERTKHREKRTKT